MDRLWAPWRIKYIESKNNRGCIFCRKTRDRKKGYVILTTKYSIALLNIFPYNNGHCMVSPKRHTGELSLLKKAEIVDLFGALEKTKALLDKVLKPHGYNIGINISKPAGAGIPDHLHMHIVPRFRGDTNFMPAIYDTRVISQSLDELYKRLIDAQPKKD